MKSLLLSLFIAVSLFAQTIDSVGVNWFDPTEPDLDSMLVTIRKVYNPTDTPIVARINEGIETARFVPADTGLYFVAPIAKDDSGNVAIPVFTLAAVDSGWTDTVTVWQTGSAVTLVTNALAAHWDFTDLANDSVATWADQIASLTLAQTTLTARPVKSASGVTFDGGDGLAVANNIAFDGAVTIEVVISIADTAIATYQGIFGGRNTNGILYMGLLNTGTLNVTGYDGTNLYDVGVYSSTVFGDTVHIAATFTGDANPLVYINGVLRTDIADPSNFPDNNRVSMGNVDGEHSPVANGTVILAASIYTAVKTQEEIDQNIAYYQSEGYLP